MKEDPDHIHKLIKHVYPNKTQIFFCVLNCNYKVEAPLALGKVSLCNICNEPFTMSKGSLKLREPHCANCGRHQIKDEDGTKRFVRKVSGRIFGDMASKTVNDLESRLHSLTQGSADEDI